MKRTNPKKLSISSTVIRTLRPLADDDARRVGGASNRPSLCLGFGCGDSAVCAVTTHCP